ncbi:MAG TPA: hypothetical protein VII41_13915, partial [Steroidobacteraceae bacterium]
MLHRQNAALWRGVSTMLDSAVRFDPAEDPISRDRSRSAAAMAELFAPLDRLLGCGGDPRLRLNPATG